MTRVQYIDHMMITEQTKATDEYSEMRLKAPEIARESKWALSKDILNCI